LDFWSEIDSAVTSGLGERGRVDRDRYWFLSYADRHVAFSIRGRKGETGGHSL